MLFIANGVNMSEITAYSLMQNEEIVVRENELTVPQLVSYIKAIGYAETSLQRDAMIEIALASVEGRSPNDEARKILDYSSKKTSDSYF